ncbi:MAG: protein-glutamate O-methyltransferase CheR [Proteobacteria bacterium]|nr:protein-glutamate O-methyltransferase CheR [Pseudomonadota bacterium]
MAATASPPHPGPAAAYGGAPRLAISDADFTSVCSLIKRLSGINLSPSKRELVQGRLARRIRELGMNSFQEYLELLNAGDADEYVAFCNSLTTNLTSFFRESHHFDYLKSEVLAPLASTTCPGPRLRIWSAACSTGEEPYSIAMTVAEALPDWQRRDIRILATDLDSNVLATARNGVYRQNQLAGLSPRRRSVHFRPHDAESQSISADLARLVTFKRLNLMEPFPMTGPIEVIFCRNVVIYFDKPTQRELFARIAKLQRGGATLFIGHSESLFRVSNDYSLIGRTTYRRTQT